MPAMTDADLAKARYAHPIAWSYLLSYDAGTGILIWKHRPRAMFGSNHHYKTWNTRFAGKEAGGISRGYVVIRMRGTSFPAHRIIWDMVRSECPTEIDHINGIRSDNRLANLRNVTPSENQRNRARSSNNKSGCTGVHFEKRRGLWMAHIQSFEKSHKHLGYFKTKDEAIIARKAAEHVYGYHDNHDRLGAH